jgi:putative heme-binding domain-containing protein
MFSTCRRILGALALPAALLASPAAPADDGGYRLRDGRATVRVLATIPGESLAQVVVDPAGRLFLGGREAVFVVEPGDVEPGLTPAELYREPGDRWFMGLAPRGRDLYVARHDAVLMLPGAVVERGRPIEPKPIVWGFGAAKGWAFHQTLHDLKVGPDGLLYFSMGDPGWFFGDFRHPDHWFRTRIETAGTPARRDVVSVGGIFRCEPDGSNLELIMNGTRNSNGFDWNADLDLFTTDNDHEQDLRYVPARLLFVAPGGSYNWPRGWMQGWPENMPSMAGMGREVPVGLAVYGDTRFPEDYRGNILLARWGQFRIDRFVPERVGAGYTAREIPWLECPPGRRPMAVAVGRGGRIYALVSHMETNAESPTYTADLLEIDVKGGAEGFAGFEPAEATTEGLYRELSSPDLSRRAGAHVELLRRRDAPGDIGAAAVADGALDRLAASGAEDPARRYLVRLAARRLWERVGSIRAGGAARTDEELRAFAAWFGLLNDPALLAGVLPTSGRPAFAAWFLGRVLDGQAGRVPSARLAALSAAVLGEARESAHPPETLARALREAESDDPYLRLIAATLAARYQARGVEPTPLPDDAPAPARLARVLADGIFLTIPRWDAPLPDGLELAPSNYEDIGPDGPRLGLFTTASWWKALEKTPSHESAFDRLVRALDDPDPTIRHQALRSLDRLDDPRAAEAVGRLIDRKGDGDVELLDRALTVLARMSGPEALGRIAAALAVAEADSTRRAAAEALVSLDLPADRQSEALAGSLAALAKDGGLDDATRRAAVGRLGAPGLLRTLVLDPETEPMFRASAIERYAALADVGDLAALLDAIEPDASRRLLAPAARLAATKLPADRAARRLGAWLGSPNEDARIAAAQALSATDRPELLELARDRLAAEASGHVLKPLAEAILAHPDADGAEARDAALARLVRSGRGLDGAPRARALEHLAKRPGYANLAGEAPEPAPALPEGFAGVDWSTAWREGNVERGRQLFTTKESLSCIACHRFGGEGGDVGPSLEQAGRRLSPSYVAESVLRPSAQVAPQYRAWTLALDSGEVLAGVLLEEGPGRLVVGLPDGTTRALRAAEVAERRPSPDSIMPEGLAGSADDLRDIMAYLLSGGSGSHEDD